jgi:hypothetical protein
LVLEAQDLTWKTRADQVDIMALAVQCADYPARAFMSDLAPNVIGSDHGILLEKIGFGISEKGRS